MKRHYLDGKPYYCADCGLGAAEVAACEDGPCTMETEETAKLRRERNPEKAKEYDEKYSKL